MNRVFLNPLLQVGSEVKSLRVPWGRWKNINLQRDALERFGIQLGVKELEDWYSVDATHVKKELSFIMNYYRNSLYVALQKLYPQHNWDPLKFSKVPRGHWMDTNAQRDALEKIGAQLGVKELDDWYSVDSKLVLSELSFISYYYRHSFYRALKTLYPNHNWNPLKFSKVPRGHWTSINKRDALEQVGIKFGVKELDDWYNVNAIDVCNELSFINNHYKSSLYAALKEIYPQHNWDPLKFSKAPQGYWQQPNTSKHFHKLFIKWKKQHKIQRLRDWYQLPPQKVKLFQRAAQGIFGSVTKMLREWFPETKWMDQVQGSAPELELQMMLRLATDSIIPHYKFGQHSVDVFVPEWNVAIEYQGVHHYQQNWRGDFNGQKRRDASKTEYLLQQEVPISLVPISYRWNGTWSQLRSTIRAIKQSSTPQVLQTNK